jgi:hypothetical protein
VKNLVSKISNSTGTDFKFNLYRYSTAVGVDADEDFFRRRSGPEGLEDGTPPFAALAAIPAGFRRISLLAGLAGAEAEAGAGAGVGVAAAVGPGAGGSRAGAAAAEAHARAVARRAAKRLAALRHSGGGDGGSSSNRGGSPAVILYGAGWMGLNGGGDDDDRVEEVAVGVGAGGVVAQGPTVGGCTS